MPPLSELLDVGRAFLPALGALAISALAFLVVQRSFARRQASSSGHGFARPLALLGIALCTLVLLIVSLPLRDATRGQLLSLLGVLLSGTIALSSTTFIGNALAGILLRGVRNFRAGDFIRVEGHFGRVSDRGLFHTEVQTEDRDLTTLPNLFLVKHPVTVIRSSGTIVAATVSLGYDVPRARVEALLLQAARQAGLDDPFVHLVNLGDFSVTYRIAGLLTEVKQLLSVRSRLMAQVLDALHGGHIEIVSPTFMNTRALAEGRRFIPDPVRAPVARPEATPEAVVFDKADEAESLERLKQTIAELTEELEELREQVRSADEAERPALTVRAERLEARREVLRKRLAAAEE